MKNFYSYIWDKKFDREVSRKARTANDIIAMLEEKVNCRIGQDVYAIPRASRIEYYLTMNGEDIMLGYSD